MELESIGKNIRNFRRSKKMRQEDLAEKAGLSTNYIGSLERGEKVPSLETFIEIANVLGVSADMLLYDLLDHGYQIKNSIILDQLQDLSLDEKARIYDVIDVLIQHASSDKQ